LTRWSRARCPAGLAGCELEWSPEWAVSVVQVSAGDPESSSTGDVIGGLGRVPDGDRGNCPARIAAYAAADMVDFPGRQLRRDIGARAVPRAR
jgi:phosphoribosylamine--glycine ligase